MTEIDSLREFSARIGADTTLVQGAGGNTSVKSGATLIVKASGKRLADAMSEDVFAELPLAEAREMKETPAAKTGLRPSIETCLHAILPHRVVAHVHSVDVLAEAVRTDARQRLDQRLAGLDWAFVPYSRPGIPLARAVQAAAGPATNVFILGNHGLLVGADDFAACEALIADVRRRLRSTPREASPAPGKLAEMAKASGLEPATHPEAHWAALDRSSLAAALRGTLYPDHVVFLGRGAARLAPGTKAPSDGPSKLFLVEGVGAFLPPGSSPAAHEMAGCLGMIVSRVEPNAPISTLSAAQEDELLNWDAEKHRQRLAGARS